ncbi:MAG: AbrB/MazE/SpoVT family DNA-binding domain-containing protein [Thermoplasmata archaeon]
MTAQDRLAEGSEGGRGFLRSIQRTGLSSLTVTLPKSWTEAYHLTNGSLVQLSVLGDGRLEVSPAGRPAVAETARVLHIDATGAPPKLVARLLVGAYITGHDQIVVSARRELSEELRQEVQQVTGRVLGMTLTQEEPSRLEVGVFLDATKHRLSTLQERVVRMIRFELELCRTALESGQMGPLLRVDQVEEEIDRFYLLMSRQILLASNDFRVAREIGVPSHHFQLGYRMVAKMLEVTADLVATVATELTSEMPQGGDAQELGRILSEFDASLLATTSAFSDVSPVRAHAALEQIEHAALLDSERAARWVGRSRDKSAAAKAQRILSSLATARQLLEIINETTINRSVEPETIARSGGGAMCAAALRA